MASSRLASWQGVLAFVLALPGISACDDKGDPSNQDNEGTGYGDDCEDTVTVLASVDEVSAAGIAGQALLDAAVGVGPLTLTWTDPAADGAGFVVVTNATPGPVELTLGALYEGGEVRYVASAPTPGDGSEEPAIYVECPDRIEVDVALDFATGDGLFAEQFQTTLVHRLYQEGDPAGLGPRVSAAFTLDLSALAGGLEVVEVQPEPPETLTHTFSAAFPLESDAMSPPSGEIGSQGTWSYDNGIQSAAFFTMASW
jgi:hypothetical protein